MFKGYLGMGQYDFFLACFKFDGVWGCFYNLGYFINIVNNEGVLIVSLDGKIVYFDMDQFGFIVCIQEMGNVDLYIFDFYLDVCLQFVIYVEVIVWDVLIKCLFWVKLEFVCFNI